MTEARNHKKRIIIRNQNGKKGENKTKKVKKRNKIRRTKKREMRKTKRKWETRNER